MSPRKLAALGGSPPGAGTVRRITGWENSGKNGYQAALFWSPVVLKLVPKTSVLEATGAVDDFHGFLTMIRAIPFQKAHRLGGLQPHLGLVWEGPNNNLTSSERCNLPIPTTLPNKQPRGNPARSAPAGRREGRVRTLRWNFKVGFGVYFASHLA